MSADLTWLLVRNNNSFMVKRNGLRLSSEPGNLMNVSSFKFSGLAQKKTVGVSTDGKTVSLRLTRRKSSRRPAKSAYTTPLNTHMKGGKCRSAKTIRQLVDKSHYRRDLAKYAVARYSALHRSLKVSA